MNGNYPDPAALRLAFTQLAGICKRAWEKGLMAGWSGNASMRLPESSTRFLITSAGSPKGMLEAEDCLLINEKGEKLAGRGKASSESQLHTFLYERWPAIQAILHTHPVYLQALELALSSEESGESDFPRENFLNVKLHEARMWRGHLHFAQNFPPGSAELAKSAVLGVADDMEEGENEPALPLAIWLPGHGLCAAAKNLKDCLCLTEEFEHLAQAQVLSLRKV